jgi:glycine/D-amino acid oxidase-like deaminating enzyme
MRTDIAIVGGGIAGLSTAYHLARGGAGAVTIFEREALVATHSSARNAAIYVGVSGRAWGPLSRRTRELLDEMLGPRWLRADGFLYAAPEEEMLGPEVALAREAGAPHAVLGRREIEARVPVLSGGFAEAGLLLPAAGVLDIHLITSHLAERAQAAGVRIALGSEVARVRVAGSRAAGIELTGGEIVAAEAVVLAPGAWASALGAACGAALPLQPLRRHLAQLDPADPADEHGPTVWALGDTEVYFRPESGGLLASPCDETPWPPSLPPTDPEALDRLADRLAKLAPALGLASLRRTWACLRTFAPDRLPVIGPDPRLEGLYWLAALGGSGMSVGVGAGELLAALVAGREHSLAAPVAPARLLAAPPA